MKRLRKLRDEERGITLIELIVATTTGMVIFAGLTAMVLGSMHTSTRITNRVHATQDSRRVVQRIVNELHSSCVAQYVIPVQEESSRTKLAFAHAYGSEVTPVPIKTAIALSGTNLIETTYPVASGSTPKWVFSTTASATRTIIDNAGAFTSTSPVFSYYKIENGNLTQVSLTGSATLGAEAAKVMRVDVALKVSPPGTTVSDPNGAAKVQGSAYLRFTSPTYTTTKQNAPCE